MVKAPAIGQRSIVTARLAARFVNWLEVILKSGDF